MFFSEGACRDRGLSPSSCDEILTSSLFVLNNSSECFLHVNNVVVSLITFTRKLDVFIYDDLFVRWYYEIIIRDILLTNVYFMKFYIFLESENLFIIIISVDVIKSILFSSCWDTFALYVSSFNGRGAFYVFKNHKIDLT